VRAFKAYETAKSSNPNRKQRVTFSEEELRSEVNRAMQQEQRMGLQEEAARGSLTGVSVRKPSF
jgi:tRNA pseudouridine-54 N-methylase